MAADENSWQNKKTSTPGVEVFVYQLITVVILGEAVSAVNRTVTGGTERNLCFNAAARAGSIVHFALGTAVAATAETTVVLFTSLSAVRAATRFVSETFFCVEILFRCSENEVCAAITAI